MYVPIFIYLFAAQNVDFIVFRQKRQTICNRIFINLCIEIQKSRYWILYNYNFIQLVLICYPYQKTSNNYIMQKKCLFLRKLFNINNESKMIFSSILFIFLFLPIVLGIHFLIAQKYRNLFILVASLFFYAFTYIT